MAQQGSGSSKRTSASRMSARNLERLGARVAQLRRDQRPSAISQRELANRSGLSPATVSQIERGKHEPRLGTLLALSEALQIGSVEELLGPMPSSALKRRGKSRIH